MNWYKKLKQIYKQNKHDYQKEDGVGGTNRIDKLLYIK